MSREEAGAIISELKRRGYRVRRNQFRRGNAGGVALVAPPVSSVT
jgi:hypothetical protein